MLGTVVMRSFGRFLPKPTLRRLSIDLSGSYPPNLSSESPSILPGYSRFFSSFLTENSLWSQDFSSYNPGPDFVVDLSSVAETNPGNVELQTEIPTNSSSWKFRVVEQILLNSASDQALPHCQRSIVPNEAGSRKDDIDLISGISASGSDQLPQPLSLNSVLLSNFIMEEMMIAQALEIRSVFDDLSQKSELRSGVLDQILITSQQRLSEKYISTTEFGTKRPRGRPKKIARSNFNESTDGKTEIQSKLVDIPPPDDNQHVIIKKPRGRPRKVDIPKHNEANEETSTTPALNSSLPSCATAKSVSDSQNSELHMQHVKRPRGRPRKVPVQSEIPGETDTKNSLSSETEDEDSTVSAPSSEERPPSTVGLKFAKNTNESSSAESWDSNEKSRLSGSEVTKKDGWLDVYIDGACKNNNKKNMPRSMFVGVYSKDIENITQGKSVFYENSNGTSNLAEVMAADNAVQSIWNRRNTIPNQSEGAETRIRIHSDSKIFVETYTKIAANTTRTKGTKKRFANLHAIQKVLDCVKKLKLHGHEIHFQRVSREDPGLKEAHKLADQAHKEIKSQGRTHEKDREKEKRQKATNGSIEKGGLKSINEKTRGKTEKAQEKSSPRSKTSLSGRKPQKTTCEGNNGSSSSKMKKEVKATSNTETKTPSKPVLKYDSKTNGKKKSLKIQATSSLPRKRRRRNITSKVKSSRHRKIQRSNKEARRAKKNSTEIKIEEVNSMSL